MLSKDMSDIIEMRIMSRIIENNMGIRSANFKSFLPSFFRNNMTMLEQL